MKKAKKIFSIIEFLIWAAVTVRLFYAGEIWSAVSLLVMYIILKTCEDAGETK